MLLTMFFVSEFDCIQQVLLEMAHFELSLRNASIFFRFVCDSIQIW